MTEAQAAAMREMHSESMMAEATATRTMGLRRLLLLPGVRHIQLWMALFDV